MLTIYIILIIPGSRMEELRGRRTGAWSGRGRAGLRRRAPVTRLAHAPSSLDGIQVKKLTANLVSIIGRARLREIVQGGERERTLTAVVAVRVGTPSAGVSSCWVPCRSEIVESGERIHSVQASCSFQNEESQSPAMREGHEGQSQSSWNSTGSLRVPRNRSIILALFRRSSLSKYPL